MATIYVPDYLFQNGTLHKNKDLGVDDLGRVSDSDFEHANMVPLKGKIMLPGFVNGHSHAFQRIIRGRTEFLSNTNSSDDFWSWREAMYSAAHALSPDDVYAVSRQAFLEMLLAGYTTVGEFHYVHHTPSGTPYADVHELANQVIAAATSVGIRIVLLRVVYERAGFQVGPNARQKRFIDSSVEQSLFLTQSLRNKTKHPLVTVALAPHSIRAVSPTGLKYIAQNYAGIIHMHVAEQPGEVAASQKENATEPVEFLNSIGMLSPTFTAVHAVHLTAHEKTLLGQSAATVCACPSTERNLGDGIVEADALSALGAPISLGSDSHATIDALDEMRQLEGHLRLKRLKRNVLDSKTGTLDSVAQKLIQMATKNGARSLGLNTGTLGVGEWADAVTVDVASLMCTENSLLSSVVFAGNSSMIQDVIVGGTQVVSNRIHSAAHQVGQQYVTTLNSIFR
jgi:formimidoylglutamate deiminase